MATQVRQLETTEVIDQRRVERYALQISRATLRGIGEDPAEATLVDLSVYGCRLQITGKRGQGERLWLRFDGSWPIGAVVIWAKDDRIGCRFDEAIPNSLMRRLALDFI